MDGKKVALREIWQSPWLWAGLLLLMLIVVRLISGYDGLYGQDPYAYYNYARDIQAFWRTGQPLGPLVWPRIYPFLGALWLWGDPAPWMQFLSMMGMALFLAMSIKLLQAAMPSSRSIAGIAFVCLGLAPFLMRSGLSIMSDAFGLGLMSWALWQGQCYLQSSRLRHLLAAAFLTGIAIWTRYPIALPMALPCLLWCLHALRQRSFAGLLLFLPVMFLAAIPHYLVLPQVAGDGFGHAFQNTNFRQWSPVHFFQRDFVQIDGKLHFPVMNLLASLGMFWHPRYLGVGLLGLLGIFWVRRNYKFGLQAWSDGGSILLYAIFLAGVPFQNARFLLPMLPFAGRLLGPGWDGLWSRISQKRWLWPVVGVFVALQLILAIFACRINFQESRRERRLAADLAAIPNQDRRLYEFTLQAMLRARHVGFSKVSMWDAGLPLPQTGDLVIFNLEAFSEQFAGMRPMQNWALLQQDHALIEIQSWEGGWKLYEVQ